MKADTCPLGKSKLENKEPNNIPIHKYFVPNCSFISPHPQNPADKACQTLQLRLPAEVALYTSHITEVNAFLSRNLLQTLSICS